VFYLEFKQHRDYNRARQPRFLRRSIYLERVLTMSNHAFLKRRDGNPVTFCENVGVDRVKVSVDGRHLIISLAEWERLPPFNEQVLAHHRTSVEDI
jgi:hypothetical protein